MKAKLLNLIAPDCSPQFQQTYLASLCSAELTPLTVKILSSDRELCELVGRNRVLLEAVADSLAGGGTVAEMLKVRLDSAKAQVELALKERVALAALIKGRRDEVAPLLAECAHVELYEPLEITKLENKVRNYDKLRTEYREKLSAAGLDDAAIERAGLRPNLKDLKEWQSVIAEKRRRVNRAKAFSSSGPVFDESLLNGYE